MPSNNESPRRVGFKHVKPGDPISAGEWNKLTKEVTRGTAQPNMHPKKPTRAIKLMQMGAAMGQFGTGDPNASGDGDSSMAHRRLARVWHYDENIDDFRANSDGEEKHNVSDALKLIYDNGELVWMMYLEQSGMWHPINPRTIRHAKTVRDRNDRYPDDCLDRIYPIKFVKMEFDRDIDAAFPVDGSFLDGGDTDPDDYVLNLFTGEGNEVLTPYIPEGTVIWCYNVLNQWYTWIDSFSCEGSSSSSDSSSGDSLSFSSNSSSNSSSSGSSASSQSELSSASLSELSSQGSSASSSSSSSQGSSFSSSNEGYTCQNFIESFSFDEETCVMTTVVKCLCWDSNLPIFVRSECM